MPNSARQERICNRAAFLGVRCCAVGFVLGLFAGGVLADVGMVLAVVSAVVAVVCSWGVLFYEES
jgi:hypothetical protein